MSVTNEQLKALSAPFSSKDIEWRVGRVSQDKKLGQALPYLTAHAVERRLDEVLGVQNWRIGYETGPAGGVMATLFIRLENGEWVGKSNMADNTDFEAVKGGASDAFKRAAKTWGVGRYLYWYQAPWVPVVNNGRSLAETPTLPDAFLPEDEQGKAPATASVSVAASEPQQTDKGAPQASDKASQGVSDKQAPAAPRAEAAQGKPASEAATSTGTSAEGWGTDEAAALDFAEQCIAKVTKSGVAKSVVLAYLNGAKARQKLTPATHAYAIKELEAA